MRLFVGTITSFCIFFRYPQKSGSFICECNSGYFGNGFDCSDVDECSNNPCDSNATCNNSAGGFTCSCNAGYSGDGVNCDDIDECASNPCDANASCTNEQGFWSQYLLISLFYLFLFHANFCDYFRLIFVQYI